MTYQTMYNEETSPTVASSAAKILAMDYPIIITQELWKEIRSVAASALTQVPDKGYDMNSQTLKDFINNLKKP